MFEDDHVALEPDGQGVIGNSEQYVARDPQRGPGAMTMSGMRPRSFCFVPDARRWSLSLVP
eukprot:2021613-Lingulodinium_polyedra.AAC.1